MGVLNRQSGTSIFSLDCGCRDSKSASVSSASASASTSTRSSTRRHRHHRKRLSVAEALPRSSTTSSAPSPYLFSSDQHDDNYTPSSPTTPSFSGLLHQLRDLEHSLENLGPPPPLNNDHRRRSGSAGKVGESVVVVKETEDPLGDFRKSMLQMIIEKEIVGGEELHELLRRFLALNSPMYHDLIVLAFADIWADVFQGFERTPDLLRDRGRRHHHR